MSVQAVSWVIDHSEHKGGALLTLIMIANYAGANGTGAWPSISRLAHDTRLTDRAVQLHIRDLVRSGELAVEQAKGPRGCNLYTLCGMGGEKISPDGVKRFHRRGEKNAPGGESHFTGGVNPISPEPLINHPLEPSTTTTRAREPEGAEEKAEPEKLPSPPGGRQFISKQPPPSSEAAIQIRLLASLEETGARLLGRPLTSSHRKYLNSWFIQHKQGLGQEVIDYAEAETAGNTDGESLKYLLTVIENKIAGRGRSVGGAGNGNYTQGQNGANQQGPRALTVPKSARPPKSFGRPLEREAPSDEGP